MKKDPATRLFDILVTTTFRNVEILQRHLLAPHLHRFCHHMWSQWEHGKRQCALCGKEERNGHA